MNAADVVKAIGDGVLAALQINQLFLGVEEFATQNADIHPEYVTTVKVGEQLTGPERIVTLEASMNALRRHAGGLARMKTLKTSKAAWPAISLTLADDEWEFGKQRLDILVRDAAADRPPLLMVEAKLGVKNLGGVVKDINRLVKLFDLYDVVQALAGHDVYGAVVFHAMHEKGTAATLPAYASTLLAGVEARLVQVRANRPNMQFRAGLLSQTLIQQPVSGYREEYDDGTFQNVFEKDQFAFQAGLVLMGTASDINGATL